MRAVRKLEGLISKLLSQFNRIIRWLSFSVSGYDEDDRAILGNLVKIIEIIFFRITDEGRKAEFLLSLFGYLDGILLGCTSLRTVKNDEAFFLSEKGKLAQAWKKNAPV